MLVFFKSSEFVSNLSKVLKLKAVYNLLFSESTRDAGISFGKPKLQYFDWLIKNNVWNVTYLSKYKNLHVK